ncbi:inositol polyphosphate-5-phosphatase A-like isoform X2 [Halichondria panicea]|uniref:inositol polyphosphate-5-phosphatase A-like isoform X2 n=1 Tax=Halichondria panicea TaxID=6063 RepID=UPI00312B3FD9
MATMALQFALNRLFVVTSNLGSVFENAEIEQRWLVELEKVIVQADPDLVALHCQEIGGKDFEVTMPKVQDFIRKLRELPCFANFDRVRGWFDMAYERSAEFTALGSLYLIHKRVEPVFLWDFHDSEFVEVKGDEVVYSDLSSNHTHCRERFPDDFYPGVKWSRKGFLHTRWRLFGSRKLNFVNIHLFHDDDNLVALETSPSVYCSYRKRALEYTLSRLAASIKDISEPLYIYGDFNFRLDFSAVVKHIMSSLNNEPQLVKETDGSVVYRHEEGPKEDVLKVERKRFALRNGTHFTEKYKELLQYDRELKGLSELRELPVEFQPSYPFSESEDQGTVYMEKRCPAWCDRILMNESALKLVVESPLGCMYNMMAKTVCVGDHKPIYLFFTVTSTAPMSQIPGFHAYRA